MNSSLNFLQLPTSREEQRLRMFGNKELRKIFGLREGGRNTRLENIAQ
jgi:hypothetical protein